MNAKNIKCLLLIVILFFGVTTFAQIDKDTVKTNSKEIEGGLLGGVQLDDEKTDSQKANDAIQGAIDGVNDANKEETQAGKGLLGASEALKEQNTDSNKGNNGTNETKSEGENQAKELQLPPLPDVDNEYENVDNLLENAMNISSIDIFHDVELIPQSPGISCWAAAAAMITAWKYEVLVDIDEIVEGIDFWEQFADVLTVENVEELALWELDIIEKRTYSVKDFAALLEEGPLWVIKNLDDKHAVVITEMSGDATSDGTLLTIYDPWDEGSDASQDLHTGSIHIKTFNEFITPKPDSSNIENEFYIAY